MAVCGPSTFYFQVVCVDAWFGRPCMVGRALEIGGKTRRWEIRMILMEIGWDRGGEGGVRQQSLYIMGPDSRVWGRYQFQHSAKQSSGRQTAIRKRSIESS